MSRVPIYQSMGMAMVIFTETLAINFMYLFFGGFASLSTLYRSYHDG